MALQKAIDTPYGMTASYWKVAETLINWAEKKSGVTLFGYYTKEAKESDCQPIATTQFNWQSEDFPFIDGEDVRKTAYDKIKTLPEWQDAIDC